MTPLDPQNLVEALGRYPSLGSIREILANGLSVNTATCLVACANQTILAKRYPWSEYEPGSIQTQHALILHLKAKGFPTPPVIPNDQDKTVTELSDGAWVVFGQAVGDDRYHDIPVFDPFFSLEETKAAGRMLARFHLALADFPTPAGQGISVADAALPSGIIHGDFIKRNLFWQGQVVSAVIDLDHWNVAPWVHDLALSLLPVGFDWPLLLKGLSKLRLAAMHAFLAGYADARPLLEREQQVLPTVMETVREGFYRDMADLWERRGRADKALEFRALSTETLGWFRHHPAWAKGLI